MIRYVHTDANGLPLYPQDGSVWLTEVGGLGSTSGVLEKDHRQIVIVSQIQGKMRLIFNKLILII